MTVVIAVYNRQEELLRALRSVQHQTFMDFECIVVDDGSTVPIEPFVAQLGDERFRYARNQVNGGPSNARLVGFRQMRGEYLCIVDSDWELFPWTLYQAVHYLDQTPEVDCVVGLHLLHEESRLFVRVPGGRKILTPKEYMRKSPVPDCTAQPALCRRAVVAVLHERKGPCLGWEGRPPLGRLSQVRRGTQGLYRTRRVPRLGRTPPKRLDWPHAREAVVRRQSPRGLPAAERATLPEGSA